VTRGGGGGLPTQLVRPGHIRRIGRPRPRLPTLSLQISHRRLARPLPAPLRTWRTLACAGTVALSCRASLRLVARRRIADSSRRESTGVVWFDRPARVVRGRRRVPFASNATVPPRELGKFPILTIRSGKAGYTAQSLHVCNIQMLGGGRRRSAGSEPDHGTPGGAPWQSGTRRE
jgi:hypothetical protein